MARKPARKAAAKTAAKAHALAGKRILISNDDGIHAPGLAVLEKAARAFSDDVWVVAPETEHSGAGHSLTLRRPLRIRKTPGRKNRFAVDGTPTDCVLLAVNQIMRDGPPDIVLSGVNRGGNMADDVTYSGTVAAAMEAAILGVPAVALSQDAVFGRECRWSTAEHWIAPVLDKVCRLSWPEGVLININFPDIPHAKVTGMEVCRQGARKFGDQIQEGRDPHGQPYYWIGASRNHAAPPKGTDLHASAAGKIAVTPLGLDFTHTAALKALKAALT
ncbi:MAG: 5'/3'-nucleotidase SurE [Rhodospirillales bacterium]